VANCHAKICVIRARAAQWPLARRLLVVAHMLRSSLLACVCVSSLMACGHPIRELAKAAKDLIPEDKAESGASCPARATTRIELIANLDARSDELLAWDPAQPEASSNFAVDSSVYAADGQTVEIGVFFTRTGALRWDWHVLAGEPAAQRARGQLTFDEEGALLAAETRTVLRLPRADGSLGAPVVLWFGTPKSADADGFDGVTSTAEPNQLTGYEQDGRARGENGDCAEPI
jgi:hypothetical protein